MGMFNLIHADLVCPVKDRMATDTEIQIKWQEPQARTLSIYHLGDPLEDIEEAFNNHWVRTEYICQVCSEKTIGYGGKPFIGADDQRWHRAFVKIKASKIEEVLDEKEFKKQRITDFVDDL